MTDFNTEIYSLLKESNETPVFRATVSVEPNVCEAICYRINDFKVIWLEDEAGTITYVGTFHDINEAVEGLVELMVRLSRPDKWAAPDATRDELIGGETQ